MLQIDRLESGYGNLPVIHGLDLRVEEGQSVAILGANGAGKSTLLKTIARWLPVQGGSIRWDDEDASEWDPVRMTKAGVVFVPQDNKVFADLTVGANLEISADLRPNGRDQLAQAYQRFPILAQRHKQKAGSLSGGERQLVAVISALILEPRLLLLDEPTSGLSPVMVEAVCELISTVIDSGVCVVWVVEQDPDTALEIVDCAHVMAGGRIVTSSEGQDLSKAELMSLLMGGDQPTDSVVQ